MIEQKSIRMHVIPYHITRDRQTGNMLVIHGSMLRYVNPDTHQILRMAWDNNPVEYATNDDALDALDRITHEGTPNGQQFH